MRQDKIDRPHRLFNIDINNSNNIDRPKMAHAVVKWAFILIYLMTYAIWPIFIVIIVARNWYALCMLCDNNNDWAHGYEQVIDK